VAGEVGGGDTLRPPAEQIEESLLHVGRHGIREAGVQMGAAEAERVPQQHLGLNLGVIDAGGGKHGSTAPQRLGGGHD
jgi:hypothetical protein